MFTLFPIPVVKCVSPSDSKVLDYFLAFIGSHQEDKATVKFPPSFLNFLQFTAQRTVIQTTGYN